MMKKGGESNSDDEKRAVELYEKYFHILDNNKTIKDQKYLSQFVALIYADYNAKAEKAKISYIKKAIKIAEGLNLPNSSIANYELNFALLRYKTSNVLQAEKLLKSSLERYQSEFGEDHFKVGENLFWLAKISMAMKKREKAEIQFLKALEIFDGNDAASIALAQSTHAFLVNLYEDMGLSDKATMHCQAIAQERPKDFDLYIDPLYRRAPEYPDAAQRHSKEGHVILEFTVDENGITKDIQVVESSSKIFENESIKAATKFRFAPSIKEGELVPTLGVRNKIIFQILK